MFVRVVRRSAVQRYALLAGLVGAGALLLRYPAAAATGGSRGLALCASVLIPTLFPFLVLTGWAARTGVCRAVGRRLARPFRRLFGLPGCGAAVWIMAAVGGYPAGGMAVRELLDTGDLTPDEARRLMRFCVNGGPAFVISTVGAGMLHSPAAGAALFAADLLASLLIGLGQNLRRHRPPTVSPAADRHPAKTEPPATALVGAVRAGCDGLLGMCGFVVLFSVVMALADLTGATAALHGLFTWPVRFAGGDAAAVPDLLGGLLEVSGGCLSLTAQFGATPFYLGFLLGFGGLSVHCQLAALLPRGVMDASFFAGRMLHGLLAGAIAWGLFWFVPPVTVSTAALPHGGSIATTAALASGSVAASAAMLMMCALLALAGSAGDAKNVGGF